MVAAEAAAARAQQRQEDGRIGVSVQAAGRLGLEVKEDE